MRVDNAASRRYPQSPATFARPATDFGANDRASRSSQPTQQRWSPRVGSDASQWRPLSPAEIAYLIGAPTTPGASARGPAPSPVQGRPTSYLPGESREHFDRRYNEWVQNNPPPEKTPGDIALEFGLGVLGSGPLPGYNVGVRPGVTLPTRPSTPTVPSRPPSPQPPGPPQPPRPQSAPPALVPVTRPGEGPTRPTEPLLPTQGPTPGGSGPGAPGAPGTGGPGEPAGAPDAPGIAGPGKRPGSPDTPDIAGPSKRPAGSPPPSAPTPQAQFEVEPTVASAEVHAMLDPARWSSPAHAFTSESAQTPEAQIYRTSYEDAFRALTPAEQYAIRSWTHVEGSEDRYTELINGQPVPDEREYQEINYELNAYLRRSGGPPDPELEAAAARLHNGLSKLPNVPMQQVPLLRVADVGADYASHFAPGDLVTNGPSFMSAASTGDYAADSFEQGYAAEGRTGGMAIYEFQAQSAIPTLPGVTTLAGHESEWLFMPHRVFKVTEMSTTRIHTQSALNLPLTAMRLEEVEATGTVLANNLHTGDPTWITPESRQPPPLPSPFVPRPGAGDSGSSDFYYSTGESD